MTTFEEISSSRRLNRSYWNEQVKFYIACYRVRANLQQKQTYFKCIKSALKCRQQFSYLEG